MSNVGDRERACELHRAARAMQAKGLLQEAAAFLREATDLDPTLPSIHNDLGVIEQLLGHLSEATACYEKAVSVDPAYEWGWANLERIWLATEKPEWVIKSSHPLLARRLLNADRCQLVGSALLRVGRAAEAIVACHIAIEKSPHHPAAFNTLGAALAEVGRNVESIEAFKRAVELEPSYARAYHNLGNSLDNLGHSEEAVAAYLEALRLDESSEETRYELAAIGDGPVPERTPIDYLLRLFDAYAARFDQHLASLNYRVPELLAAAVTRVAPNRKFRTLDLGCGTGLSGAAMVDVCESLTGVDVSRKSLDRAQERQIYQHLSLSDLLQFLEAGSDNFDLIIAADTFIYWGELEPVFRAAARRLSADGLFVFSIETTALADYVLRRTRRFSHRTSYIEQLARRTGFNIVANESAALRNDAQQPVEGRIFVLSKDDTGR